MLPFFLDLLNDGSKVFYIYFPSKSKEDCNTYSNIIIRDLNSTSQIRHDSVSRKQLAFLIPLTLLQLQKFVFFALLASKCLGFISA
jgi:hypothetical protein